MLLGHDGVVAHLAVLAAHLEGEGAAILRGRRGPISALFAHSERELGHVQLWVRAAVAEVLIAPRHELLLHAQRVPGRRVEAARCEDAGAAEAAGAASEKVVYERTGAGKRALMAGGRKAPIVGVWFRAWNSG